MAFENFDQAAEALAAANRGETVPDSPSPDTTSTAPANQPEQPQGQPTETTQAQPTEQPRVNLDQLDLSPEQRSYIEQREREMQADYTRKTQEVAAQRREAEQAMEFIQALNSDPQFAYQVHQTLSQALEQQGVFPNADQQPQVPEEDTFEDPYMQKLQELENWQRQQEQRFREAEATARIEQGISAIRQANPNYTDEDVQSILTMAFAYNGDIAQAEQAYKGVTQRVTESYLKQKESVPAQLNQPSSTGHAEIPPEGFKTLNDPRLEEAAKRMLLNAGGQW